MIGKKISHYSVTEKLGAGGMGEVYRATDTKLNRDVALKVLPEEFARDADRMARFKREAQVLASLNHPNIAAIYGLEEADGIRCLVLELVEGPTLAERIQEGAIPLKEALNIARQIAEALEAAHEKGIIHRDLKPANVKVTPEGIVKVLDFGLAKALEDDPSSIDISKSPTLSVAATRAGMILGTAAYMSPEQAHGRQADKRADIWSFGGVLYDMLTGLQAFSGESISDTLASVLKLDPDWDALPSDTPAPIRKLLRRCLDRDRKRRLQAIGEARIALEEHLADPAGSSVVMAAPALPVQPAWQRALPWALAGVLALALVLVSWAPWQAPPPQKNLRLKVEVSPDSSLYTGTGAAAVLSPDGKTLAFVALSEGTRKIYVRSLDRLEANPLSGTEGGRSPFFSPDGRWLGFFTDNALKKVAITGGAPLTLCPTQTNRGGTWSPDNIIVFASDTTSGLSRIPASGGTPEEITVRAENERSHRWPHFLPGGKAVLFISQNMTGNYDDANIEVLDLESGERRVIHQGGTFPGYLRNGYVTFIREGTLFAVPFDVRRLEVMGFPAPILEGVSSQGDVAGNGGAQYAFSEEGTLVYFSGRSSASPRTIVKADRTGNVTPLVDEPGAYWEPSISPDGTRLVFDRSSGAGFDIWIADLVRGAQTRLTFDGMDTFQPTWSHDGERVAYSSNKGGDYNIYWTRADGSGEAEQLTDRKEEDRPLSFSSDGELLAFQSNHAETSWDLWILSLEGGRKPEVFLATPASEMSAEFSFDGRWIAYASNESGRYEIYVRPYPGPGGKWQISTDGGNYPHWTKNGRELVYRASTRRWMSVSVSTEGNSLKIGTPQLLFEGEFVDSADSSNYDVSADGSWFALLRFDEKEEQSDESHLTFIFNWFEEVRRLVPAGKN